MIDALHAARKQLHDVVIEGEGHVYNHWENRLNYYRKAEDFLAECPGGRSSGFNFYQLGRRAF